MITLLFAHVVLPYDWISIAAVLTVSLVLHLIRSQQILPPIAAALDRMLCCGKANSVSILGFISAAVGRKNA